MQKNSLQRIRELGQSVWLDYLDRQILSTGKLQRLITEDGLSGVTSNPKILSDAITGSDDYDEDIEALAREGLDAKAVYEALAVKDVQAAADLLRPVYDSTDRNDGFVSLEVSPHLAYVTEPTTEEARRLWSAVKRPNVFIKVPATMQGLPAIRQLIGEGININVTLLFSLDRYRRVAEAFIAGLEDRAAAGKPVSDVFSVASFFLSRIDVLIDPQLEELAKKRGPKAELAGRLRGQAAIASAKIAFEMYKEIFAEDRFRKLARGGARPQRVLWGSTSTKNPAYSDVKYVEALIGPQTIDTMPLETLEAYRDHGLPAARLEDGVPEAHEILRRLAEAGIDLKQATEQLEKEGVEKFAKPFDKLMGVLEERVQALQPEREKEHAARR